MNTRRKQIGAGLGGAVALAFGAFALGSQAGDGSALAENSGSANTAVANGGDRRGPGGPGVEDLADRLGVDASKLEDALEDIRSQQPRPEDKRDELATGLAKKLNLDAAKVRSALEDLRPQRGDRPSRRTHERRLAAALAKELGIEAAKARAALDKVHDGGPPRDRDAFVEELAGELDVSTSKLTDALEEVKPERDRDGRRGPGGPAAADLAKALGVDQDKVEAALEELREEHQAEHEARREAFAKALADRLGIPVDRVRDELPAGPPHGRPPR